MTTAISIQERVVQAIAAGESNFREFKSAWQGTEGAKTARSPQSIRKDIGEILVSFANAEGGMLLIGVEDDGTVTGISHGQGDIEGFVKAPTSNVHTETPLPSPVVSRLSLDGKLILYFSVEKGTKYVHLTSDGKCLQRRDRDSVPVPSEQVRFERQEQLSREYDRAFVDGAGLEALDLQMIHRAGEIIAPGYSAEKLLQLLDLADFDGISVRLRRAALLLFAKNVQRWHPRCEVRVVRVSGTELRTARDYNVKTDETAHGSVFLIMSTAWEMLRPHLVQTIFGAEGLFEERVMFPEDACREAVTNAIAHRDYSIEGRGIEVFIYDDRMEVKSPGGLLSNVSLQALRALKGVHESRNAKLARVLRELGYVREMGEGIRRMYRLMKVNDLVDPELSADFETFMVVLKNRSVFSVDAQRWIDTFERFGLTREEKKIVLLGHDGAVFSPQNVIDSLAIVDIDHYREILEQLQLKGILTSKAARGAAPPHRRGGKRNVARFLIRPPQECELYFNELLKALSALGTPRNLNPSTLRAVQSSLGNASPYNTRSFPFRRHLSALKLLDESGSPTPRLLALWGSGRNPVQNLSQPPLANAPIHQKATKSEPLKTPVGQLPERDEDTRTVFVGNLPFEIERQELLQIAEEFGTVVKLTIPLDIFTGRIRGFAFVEYADAAAAQRALTGIKGTNRGGRKLRTDVAGRQKS